MWEKKTNARQFKKTSELLVACFVFSRRTFLSFFCFTRRTCQQQYYIFLQTFSPLLIFLFFFTILQRAEAKFGLEPKQKIYLKIKFTFSLNRECKSKFIKIWPLFNGGFRGKKAQSALKAKYLNCSQTTDFLVSPKIRIFLLSPCIRDQSNRNLPSTSNQQKKREMTTKRHFCARRSPVIIQIKKVSFHGKLLILVSILSYYAFFCFFSLLFLLPHFISFCTVGIRRYNSVIIKDRWIAKHD